MKIKENLILKQMGNEFVVVPVGKGVIDFKVMVTLNETGAFLWNKLTESKTEDELVECMISEYDIDKETALNDIKEFLKILTDNGLLK